MTSVREDSGKLKEAENSKTKTYRYCFLDSYFYFNGVVLILDNTS